MMGRARVYGENSAELNRCPYCHRPADAVTEAGRGGDAVPVAGDASLCFGCGRLAVFTGRGFDVRRPSPFELAAMLADPNVQLAISVWCQVVDNG